MAARGATNTEKTEIRAPLKYMQLSIFSNPHQYPNCKVNFKFGAYVLCSCSTGLDTPILTRVVHSESMAIYKECRKQM